jgi:lipopolysaccharide transport system permease protein
MTSNVGFLLQNLILRDFRIRYRNMSLGIFWSLLNPLVMMAVLTFVFTRIFPSTGQENFHVFALCGIVPFNFFALSWVTGTTSIIDNSGLIKRVRFPREILPISTVLGNCVHLGIQVALVLALVLAAGYGVNRNWAWLPFIFAMEIVFVCGLALFTAALDVRFRDVRYLVESSNTVLFWLVPIFYSFAIISPQYHWVYQYNPIAAVVLACRQILMESQMPAESLLLKLTLVSALSMTTGLICFRLMKRSFSDYL